ncbi:hypothetical protein [Actinoallomurus sp. CA-142502]|uniref:hypothetical protein n=1 Tax=Actinoallomurus sp. CA-142502 TaxID=3239885 RepID=UPI003D8B2450
MTNLRRALAVAPMAAIALAAPPFVAAHGQAAESRCAGPIRSSSVMRIDSCDDATRIIDKAAHLVPRPGQVAWQRNGIAAFICFGMESPRRLTAVTTIGYSRVLTLTAPVTTSRLRVRVEQSRTVPYVTSPGLHLTAPPS